ncbi:MAG: NAD(P)-binding domain-containing protein, partial [Muribaculaceae bacterium]|nr:NAD(P)-binding domain-containing protein [Muribaculaceae bacterium]
FGMMVTLIRNKYNGTSGTELKGKTLGLHAFGQVSRNVARIAKGFGMTVMALDPFVKDEVLKEAGVEPVHSIEELYSKNQYVSLHIPANDQTKKSINKTLMNMMPKNAVLINAARKEVINEEDLAEVLETRPDFRYIADIKPDNADELTAKYADRLLFTPKKMGAQTAEANINAGLAAAKQVLAFLNDGWNKFQVNK